jgi:hypothetical protein
VISSQGIGFDSCRKRGQIYFLSPSFHYLLDFVHKIRSFAAEFTLERLSSSEAKESEGLSPGR